MVNPDSVGFQVDFTSALFYDQFKRQDQSARTRSRTMTITSKPCIENSIKTLTRIHLMLVPHFNCLVDLLTTPSNREAKSMEFDLGSQLHSETIASL
jgi:hypothetical protein